MSRPALPLSPQPAHVSQVPSDALFTRGFLLLCASTLLFFESMFVLLAILPLFIVQELRGTESQVGIIMGAFAIAAVLTRPASGRLVDSRSRKVGLGLGALVYCFAPALYTLAGSVPVMMGLRFFHGSGIAFFTTASSVLVADISPPSRRGEAMGYYGMMMNVAMATGPVLGVALVERIGFTRLFWLAAALAFASLALIPLLSEPPRVPRRDVLPSGERPPLFSRAAVFPGFIAICMTMTFGAVLSFLPLFVQARQLGNPGVYFIVYSVAVIVSRPLAGKWSDRFGRTAVIVPGMVLLAAAMAILAYSTSMTWLLSAATLQGIGFGGAQPALMALGVDRSTEHDRGPVLATLMLAFDIGHSLSGIGLGLVLEQTSFTVMYLCTGGIALIGAGALAAATKLQQHQLIQRQVT
jgi:MFS family permease